MNSWSLEFSNIYFCSLWKNSHMSWLYNAHITFFICLTIFLYMCCECFNVNYWRCGTQSVLTQKLIHWLFVIQKNIGVAVFLQWNLEKQTQVHLWRIRWLQGLLNNARVTSWILIFQMSHRIQVQIFCFRETCNGCSEPQIHFNKPNFNFFCPYIVHLQICACVKC